MNLNEAVLKNEEKAAFMLRGLYRQYGYMQYKMSKFEEYDLYAKNRDFLISDNIITFTDTNGKLMALKPDVTLSIVRNMKDSAGYVGKFFYNENVYRVSKGSHSYKEIMQAGIESIGDIDSYNIFETVLLAAKSLELISKDSVLNISHLDIVGSLLDEIGLSEDDRRKAIKLIGLKNAHELGDLCERYEDGNSKEVREALGILMSGKASADIIKELKASGRGREQAEELEKLLSDLEKALPGMRVAVDFSVVNDMNYYNGIVFNGYINGVPEAVLSGGQYDPLLKKMGKNSKGIGFAVYLDFLERYFDEDNGYDVDILLKYDDSADVTMLNRAAQSFIDNGLSVSLRKKVPDKLRFKELYILDDEGVLRRPGNHENAGGSRTGGNGGTGSGSLECHEDACHDGSNNIGSIKEVQGA